MESARPFGDGARPFGDGDRPFFLRLALLGFYWYFLSVFWGIDGHHMAALLLFIYLIHWAVQHWSDWKRSSLAWLLIAGGVYIGLRYTIAYLSGEDDLAWNVTYQWPFLKLSAIFPFVLVPFLVAANRVTYLNRAFALLLLGLAAEVVLELFVGDNARGIAHVTSHRPGYGMGPITFGVVSGFLAIGVMALGGRFHAMVKGRWPALRLPATLLVFLTLVLLFTSHILTQSVGNWAASIMALTTLLVFWLGTRAPEGRTGRRRRLGLAALSLTAIAILVWANWELIDDRLRSKHIDVADLLTTDPGRLPDAETVLGARYDLYMVGVAGFAENPVFGILPNAVDKSIVDHRLHSRPHVHNLPLQVLASFGILGFGLLVVFVVISILEIRRARREGFIPNDWALFWYVAFAFFLVNSLFDLMLKNREIITLLAFMASLPVALQIARCKRNRSDRVTIQPDPMVSTP